MSRLLKSQNYLMNYFVFVLLLGFISLGAIGGCSDNGSDDNGGGLGQTATDCSSTEECVEILLSTGSCIGCNLVDANLSDADLRGADLRGAGLSGADLRAANLSDAKLLGANLFRAKLVFAFLNNAFLNNADLSDADLSDANLIGANLVFADLFRVNLSDAIWCNGCLCTDPSIGRCNGCAPVYEVCTGS